MVKATCQQELASLAVFAGTIQRRFVSAILSCLVSVGVSAIFAAEVGFNPVTRECIKKPPGLSRPGIAGASLGAHRS